MKNYSAFTVIHGTNKEYKLSPAFDKYNTKQSHTKNTTQSNINCETQPMWLTRFLLAVVLQNVMRYSLGGPIDPFQTPRSRQPTSMTDADLRVPVEPVATRCDHTYRFAVGQRRSLVRFSSRHFGFRHWRPRPRGNAAGALLRLIVDLVEEPFVRWVFRNNSKFTVVRTRTLSPISFRG